MKTFLPFCRVVPTVAACACFVLALTFGASALRAQTTASYTSYFTGDTTNFVPTSPLTGGVCIMGGATENDSAMVWFLRAAKGGDVLVLRTSGGNGYNAYMYSQLGVNVNSVETILFNDSTAAFSPYVIKQIQNAEAIWLAGGDQAKYVRWWKNTPVMTAINNFLNVKHGMIGGTSAGAMILGQGYFSALNGSVTSDTALLNPYSPKVTVGYNDFLQVPTLKNTIIDTHYNNPDRRGRHAAFIARIMKDSFPHDNGHYLYGIGCGEYTAVCMYPSGDYYVYGDYPTHQDFVYFLQTICGITPPDSCQAGYPLSWGHSVAALAVSKVGGTPMGAGNNFNFDGWRIYNNTITGGGLIQWDCAGATNSLTDAPAIAIAPNPTPARVTITVAAGNDKDGETVQYALSDALGRVVQQGSFPNTTPHECSLAALPSGLYFLELHTSTWHTARKVVKAE